MTATSEEREAFEAAVAAAMRALAEDDDIDLTGLEAIENAGGDLRGAADREAFRRRYHDPLLHQKLRPRHADTAMAATLLEYARCEALGAARMRGAAVNMQHAIEEEISGSPTRAQSVYFSLWQALTERKFTKDFPAGDTARIEKHAELMKEVLSDQAAYAQMGEALLKDLGFETDNGPLPSSGSADTDGTLADDAAPDDDGDKDESGAASGQEDSMQKMMATAALGEAESAQSDPQNMRQMTNALLEELVRGRSQPTQEQQLAELPQYARQFALEMADYSYNIYTTEFDMVEQAGKLATPEELIELRKYLDEMMASTQKMIGRFAAKLQRYILARQKYAYQFSYDTGLLDHKRLGEIVTNPDNPLCYKQSHDAPFRDTVVSLLIDNSGSMRGRPIMTAAISTEILARTLERCGIRTEILGFTTKHWKGGDSQKKWKLDGSPPAPGRLNDLLHIIYKSADTPWRRARMSLSLMLQDGLLKENIDGEALLWAYDRLRAMPEERKILIVISDGAPIDDATLSCNHSQCLEEHLHKVIHWLENKKNIELLSIGIGHDVTRYYQKAVKITDVNDLAETLVDKMIEMLA